MEGWDGAYGTIMRHPIDVAERESGDQAGGEQLVDIVRIKVLDWVVPVSDTGRLRKGTVMGTRTGTRTRDGRGANRLLWTTRRAVP